MSIPVIMEAERVAWPDAFVSLQHYAQCELLPREGACSPDTSVSRQFRQHVEANGVMSV